MAVSKRQRKPMNLSPTIQESPPPLECRPKTIGTVLSEDRFLRDAGFQIVSRPRPGVAMWKHRNRVRVVTHAEALATARLEVMRPTGIVI